MKCKQSDSVANKPGQRTSGTPPTNTVTHCFKERNFITTLLILVIFVSALVSPVHAGDISNAALQGIELGQALEKGLKSGRAVWLQGEQEKFLAVFNPDQSGEPKGGVIILHDADSHPDKPEVIRPLRRALPLQGWVTLAIQLPMLNSPGDYTNHQKVINIRIDNAIAHMQKTGFSNLVLLGHGTGTLAAASYLANQSSDSVQAFIGISLGIPPEQAQASPLPKQLEKIALPTLDIYGSNDLDYVVNSAKQRALAAQTRGDTATRTRQLAAYMRSGLAVSSDQKLRGYISYRQIRIEGASHDFSGSELQLTKRISGWLDRHAKGVAISSRR